MSTANTATPVIPPSPSPTNCAPRRILLLDTGHEWGGGTNSMFELLKRIDRQQFAVTCCFYKDYPKGQTGRRLSEELAAIGIPLHLLTLPQQPWWAKLAKEVARGVLAWHKRWRQQAVLAIDHVWRIQPAARQIAALLRQGHFDLLYMNNQPSSNLEGYFAAAEVGIPLVQHCRIEPTLRPQEVNVINQVQPHIIAVSQGVANTLVSKGVQPELVSVVYNAIDGSISLPPIQQLSLPDNSFVIGTVGQLTVRKGILHLLMAVVQLHQEGIPVHVLILGEGPQEHELKTFVKEQQIEDIVHFLGFQTQPLAWVQALDVCVLCSAKEGLPRVVLEGMLTRKPVVGSNVTGTNELIIQGETGLLYSYGDIAELVKALRTLWKNPELRQTMGAAGRQRVVANFSIAAYVAGVSAVLARTAQAQGHVHAEREANLR